MHKFFLLIIGISTFLFAEYMSESELLMQQNLEDIKSKYHIPDENPAEVLKVEKTVPKLKLEKTEKTKSSSTKKKNKTEDIIDTIKDFFPKSKKEKTSNDSDKLQQIRKELHIKELTPREKKLDRIRSELKIGYEVPKKESSLDKHLASVQKSLHMEGDIEGEYSFSNTVNDLKKTLNLDSTSSWGLMDMFGAKKKKKKKGLFGIGILGDVKDTGTSIYKGMKYSGQSAELMSGMMYNSSKMYNTMFGLFDDSPFNIFEEEEDPSMFDFIQGGNTVMDFFN